MRRVLLFSLAAASALAWSAADRTVPADMAESAAQFLRALDPEKKTQASFAYDVDERYNFHYIPRERKGVPLKNLTPAERKLASSLLASGVSAHGMRRALDIMYLDQVLFEKEKNPIRDADLYYITVFGEPAVGKTWGWRVEGHHLSLNFTVRGDGVVSSSPSFWGANPAHVLDGPQKGMRVLAEEELMGRALLQSLDGRDVVLIEDEAPSDIVTRVTRKVDIGAPAGLPASSMSREGRDALRTLIGLYAQRLRPELAEAELAKVDDAGLENVHFAWAGGSEPGEPHYYRIHGPTFLIEYDNTQNDANHIHTVWRDPVGDWGEDPLAAHYETSPHHQHPHAHAHSHGHGVAVSRGQEPLPLPRPSASEDR